MNAIDVAKAMAAKGLQPRTIADFVKDLPDVPLAVRREIVEQALLLMDVLYVHLPLKMAMHAVNPVQELRLLRHRLGSMSEKDFHATMLSIFLRVRDLHTNYVLPNPYRSHTAVLPFELGEFFHDDKPKHVVTSVYEGLNHPTFRAGVAPTYWNGIPIARAIAMNADRHAGCNAAARHARGLQRLTVRPLAQSLLPDEEWVDLRYFAEDGQYHEIRLPWLVLLNSEAIGISGIADGSAEELAATGIDDQTESANHTRRRLFQTKLQKIHDKVLAYLLDESQLESMSFVDKSTMPWYFSFRKLDDAAGQLGYLRIHSFNTSLPVPGTTADGFVQEFVRILELLPKRGLILDVRGNGGGNIIAGEKLLQTLTDKKIYPEQFHFINNDQTLRLVSGISWLKRWEPSIRRSVQTGAVYSQGLPIIDDAETEYNKLGRKYHGPVVLLTDAFCYSTTDIFAAGFQDHGIGEIIGVDTHTGAGGANVFAWSQVVKFFEEAGMISAKKLPDGADFRVAVRRSTRVGPNSGVPLEDLGVEPNRLHKTTLDDLLHDDRDLLAFAGSVVRAGNN